MNIYSVCNVDGDCEWQGVCASADEALATYRKESGVTDEEFEGTTAHVSFVEETKALDQFGMEAWLSGYCFAVDKFAG